MRTGKTGGGMGFKPGTTKNQTGIILTLILLFVWCPVSLAESLEPALHQLAEFVIAKAPGTNGNRNIAIRIVESRSGQRNETSDLISTKLELALLQQLVNSKTFQQPASDFEILINGNYRLTGNQLNLRFEIRHHNTQTDQSIRFVKEVRAAYHADSKKRHVLVLNIASSFLNESLNNRFSNSFRTYIKNRNIFILESDRFRPNTDKCKSINCLSALGKKVDTDFVLAPTLNRQSPELYLLTADLIDVKKAHLISRISISHAGSLGFLEGSLDDLSYRIMLQERMLKAAADDLAQNRGHLLLTSEPSGADVYLNHDLLNHPTNDLFEDIDAGRYNITFRIGGLERAHHIDLEAGEIKKVHAVLKLFEVTSFSMIKVPGTTEAIGLKLNFTLPIDPASVNQQTFYLQKEREKIAGKITVEDNSLIFIPESPLKKGTIYTIIATQDIRNFQGDSAQTLYERHFRFINPFKDQQN